VVAGSAYDFRVRSLRSSSSASTWVEVDDYTVSIVLSTVAASTVSGLTAAAVAHLSALTTLAADPVTPGMGAAAQVGAGATVAVTGSAAAGTITLTTGTGTLAAGQICTVTFQSALASTPNGVCAANGSPIPGLSWVATSTVLTLSVSTALAPSTVYEIGYSLS
jgi:flagellar capping protein FliD